MLKLRKILNEMATPRAIDLSKDYYHGTSTDKAAKAILRQGIKPIDTKLILKKYKSTKAISVPVKGKVYITPSIYYATIYALGGVYMGDHMNRQFPAGEKNGYVFVIDGSELRDIQPDEDSVGELAYAAIYSKDEEKYKDIRGWLGDLVRNNFQEQWIKHKFIEAQYGDWIRVGKKLLPKLTDEQKLALIDAGAHIAHTGNLEPRECWRIPKKYSHKLSPSAHNFFTVAKKVWPKSND